MAKKNTMDEIKNQQESIENDEPKQELQTAIPQEPVQKNKNISGTVFYSSDDAKAAFRAIPQISSAEFVTRNSLKIMDGKYGGGFYARLVLDNVKKHSWRELVIVYPDKTSVTIFLFRNVFRKMPEDGNGFFVPPPIKSKRERELMYGMYEDSTKPYDDCELLKAYETPDMPIPCYTLATILSQLPTLPVVKIHDSISIEGLFAHMLSFVKGIAKVEDVEFVDNEDYFMMSTSQFRSVCSDCGWKPTEALREFEKAGLLVSDVGNGYQFSLRIGTKHLRMYKFLKKIPHTESNITSLENTDFKYRIKPMQETLVETYNARMTEVENILDSISTKGTLTAEEKQRISILRSRKVDKFYYDQVQGIKKSKTY